MPEACKKSRSLHSERLSYIDVGTATPMGSIRYCLLDVAVSVARVVERVAQLLAARRAVYLTRRTKMRGIVDSDGPGATSRT